MERGNCQNCGGSEGIHHYLTMQCPVGGREAAVDRKQEYKNTTYKPPEPDRICYGCDVTLSPTSTSGLCGGCQEAIRSFIKKARKIRGHHPRKGNSRG